MNMSELLNLGIDQYADIGFTLLIAGVCLRTLLFDREVNVKQRMLWKQELLEVEKSLKMLIDEATHASSIFDRQITEKQGNIQKLVNKAESLLKASISNAKINKSKSISSNQEESLYDEGSYDFPYSTSKTLKAQDSSSDWTYGEEIPSHLVDAIEVADREEDPSYNKRNVPQKNRKTMVREQLDKNMILKNEEKKKQELLLDEKIFSQTSIVDPVAFRIAKRLLLEGKELHVIARKLEMPVSEIRHLETLIRQQAQEVQAELPETFKAKDIEQVKKVIRDPGERKQVYKPLAQEVEAVSTKDQTETTLVFEEEIELPLTLEK